MKQRLWLFIYFICEKRQCNQSNVFNLNWPSGICLGFSIISVVGFVLSLSMFSSDFQLICVEKVYFKKYYDGKSRWISLNKKKRRNHTLRRRRRKKSQSYETDSVINPKSFRKWVLACKSLGVRASSFSRYKYSAFYLTCI